MGEILAIDLALTLLKQESIFKSVTLVDSQVAILTLTFELSSEYNLIWCALST